MMFAEASSPERRRLPAILGVFQAENKSDDGESRDSGGGRAKRGVGSDHLRVLLLPLPVNARHFDRWLALFEDTAHEICPPAAAEHFIERAHRVADSLELGIAGQHRVLLLKGNRLRRPDADVFLPAQDAAVLEQSQ